MQTLAGAPATTDAGDLPALTRPHLLECSDCGQMQHLPAVEPGTVARCRRCDAVLRRTRRDPFGLPFMLVVTALLLFTVALSLTLMGVSTAGIQHSATLFSGPESMEAHGFWEVGGLVALTTIGMPGFMLASLLYVMVGLRSPHPPRHMRTVLGWVERLRPWAMVDVYLLGLFVAYVKLQPLVRIELGPAFYALCGLMVAMVATAALTDPEALWDELDRRGIRPVTAAGPPGREGVLIGCHVCHQVSRASEGSRGVCPRCATPLHRRKPNAIARCWALVITSALLYIPANFYPVLTLTRLGSGAPSTILGGVEELLAADQWPLALLVFSASIMVPMLKLTGLAVLLISVQRRWTTHLRDRTTVFRIVNTIGRWSMIDIFMVSLLVALVQFGKLSSVTPGLGAIAFGAVVILTMLAAECFDPRLIWDAAGENAN